MPGLRAVLCALVFLSAGLVRAEAAGEIEMRVSGLEGVSGVLYVALYDNDDDWLGDGAIQKHKVVIDESRQGPLVVSRLQAKPGEYALTVYYDANGNGKLDRNFIGLPKEPVALSNNAKARFGPPKYDDAKFTVVSDQPIVLDIEITSL